jgi:hypothetical protein
MPEIYAFCGYTDPYVTGTPPDVVHAVRRRLRRAGSNTTSPTGG